MDTNMSNISQYFLHYEPWPLTCPVVFRVSKMLCVNLSLKNTAINIITEMGERSLLPVEINVSPFQQMLNHKYRADSAVNF